MERILLVDNSKIFIGGIAVSLLHNEFQAQTGIENILIGQLLD